MGKRNVNRGINRDKSEGRGGCEEKERQGDGGRKREPKRENRDRDRRHNGSTKLVKRKEEGDNELGQYFPRK